MSLSEGMTRARGLAAGRPGDQDLRGQGRPDRSAGSHAARLDGCGAHEARHGAGHRNSRDGSDRVRPQAGGLGRRPERHDRVAAECGGGAQRPRDGRHRGRPRYGRDRRNRGYAGAASWPEDPPDGCVPVMRFNLSEWALNHRSFVVYCMVALTIVGAMSYYRLGRNEDPAFTFRTMVVQAGWPGATLPE